MSLLTPLYIVGLLAVGLPVLFHLIRRMPRGEFSFSSLMFLSPSPPRLTKRSRLDNLLLLILRATVLALLATAFARPFVRRSADLDFDWAVRRKIAVLIDTSASMRRGSLWQEATTEVNRVLDDLGPRDEMALFAFNSKVQTVVPFGDPDQADSNHRAARIQAHLENLAPTWAGSDLSRALIHAADEVHQSRDSVESDLETIRQVVLISDLQQGSRLDAIQTYHWPEDVRLTVRSPKAAKTTNAGLRIAGQRGDNEDLLKDNTVRVRVTNDTDSTHGQFQLRWSAVDGRPSTADLTDVFVPPGTSRTVSLPLPIDGSPADRLELLGDDHDFDNVLHLVPLVQESVPLLYLGDDAEDDVGGLRFYLRHVFPETPRRKVDLLVRSTRETLSKDDLASARMIVVGAGLANSGVDQLKECLRGGRTVLVVLTDDTAGAMLGRLIDTDRIEVVETPSDDYAILGRIDFTHPLFTPLADPGVNDFSKIHFWRHRRVNLSQVPDVAVLARFDDGDPALFEKRAGRGRLVVLTSGWSPADSQCARSSKFPPLLSRLLELSGVPDLVSSQYIVGDPVTFDASQSQPSIVPDTGQAAVSVRRPDGTKIDDWPAGRQFDKTDIPGVYQWSHAGQLRQFAVNVSGEETRTAPLDPEELQRRGALLGAHPSRAELVEQRRQMRNAELEGRQKLWRWLIVAAMSVLVVETWLAGRLAVRRQSTPQPSSKESPTAIPDSSGYHGGMAWPIDKS